MYLGLALAVKLADIVLQTEGEGRSLSDAMLSGFVELRMQSVEVLAYQLGPVGWLLSSPFFR